MKLLLLLLLIAVLGSCFQVSNRQLWNQFKRIYEKNYPNAAEEFSRFQIFSNNVELVKSMSLLDENVEYGMNQFMDLSQEEFASMYLMKDLNFSRFHPRHPPTVEFPANDRETRTGNSGPPPTSYDWRSANAVTPVYNQEQCGSCWAFSTTEEIESQWFLAGNQLTQLSMQQIVSCDHQDSGCNGGEPPTAYKYVISAGGLDSYSSYPYTSGAGNSGQCKFNKANIAAKISNWAWVSVAPFYNETAMLYGSWQYGPLSICVDASSWQFYTGGIVTSNCGTKIDHCVQLVGWNTSPSGIPYWIVRNSWGTSWGNNGYIYIERNKNLCAIAEEVSRAIV